MGHVSNEQFFATFTLSTVVGVAVFLHADRTGSRHPTAWGISVFLVVVIGLPVYLVHVFRNRRAHGA